MDMYKEMQEELSQKHQKEEVVNVKKAPKPKAVPAKEGSENKTYCPEYGEPLNFEEDTISAKNCGWSKCH